MLTDSAIRKAKPAEKPQRLFDAGGLYLEVSPSGGKWWRLKYRYGGKEKRLSLGVYPDTTLAAARAKRDDARKLLASGVDPSENRKAKRAASDRATADSFEVVTREWFAKQAGAWAASHASTVMLRFENDVFPWLGKRPIGQISARELLETINRIVDRGANESAHRVLQSCGQVFRYAVATGRAERNPAADLRGALPPVRAKHHAAILDPTQVGALLRAMHSYQGSFIVRCALRLAPLVFVRPGELRHAEWSEIDLEAAQWKIPAEKMKMRSPHLVPLSRQALEILRELQPLTGSGRYVFPSVRTDQRPMSENTVLAALRRMGFAKDEMTGHGFRAMARTILDETLGVRPEYIEHQLAHAVRDTNGTAYNRTTHLPERRAMMQAWADWLETVSAT